MLVQESIKIAFYVAKLKVARKYLTGFDLELVSLESKKGGMSCRLPCRVGTYCNSGGSFCLIQDLHTVSQGW